jgi:hypothetical protein
VVTVTGVEATVCADRPRRKFGMAEWLVQFDSGVRTHWYESNLRRITREESPDTGW